MIDLEYPSIEDSVSYTYESVTDRYYSRRYCVNVNNIKNNDFCLLFHSNRICVLTLAPTHPFFKTEGNYKINFTPGNVNRSKVAVKGKGKKGGQPLEGNSKVCSIEFDNGPTYMITSCVKGRLVEINEALMKNPLLLRDKPDSDGYVAVVLQGIKESDSLKDELMGVEEYSKYKSDL